MSSVETSPSLLELTTRVPPNRILSVRGSLLNQVAASVKFKLGEMQAEEGDILFLVDSIGGHVKAGIALNESFRTSPQRIIGKVEGKAASAGFMALQGCAIRVATPNSILVIHDTGTMDPNPFMVKHDTGKRDFIRYHLGKFDELLHEAQTNHEAIIQILLARSKYFENRADLEYFLDQERQLTPEEAIRYGFLDGVI